MTPDDDAVLQRDAVFSVGKVVSVEGRRVRVAVDKLKNSSHLLYRGDIVRNVAVGSYLKIAKGFDELIAVVDGEQVSEDRSSADYRRSADPLARALDVSLIGYLERGKFIRGVREMPLLDNECFILSEAEFEAIHTFVAPGEVSLPIGTLAMEPSQEVRVGVDAIFASHVGIFGNTGSGKSYTLAKLYHELFKHFSGSPGFADQAQFVLIDFNGEYVDRASSGDDDTYATSVVTGSGNKVEYALSTRGTSGARLPLPRSAVEDVAFWSVLLDATEKTQAPFLARVLGSDYWERRLQHPNDLLEVIGDMVLRATKSSDISIDRQTVLNLLGEIRTCLGEAVPQELTDLYDDFDRNLHYNSSLRKFYWGDWAPPYYDPDHPDWESLTRQKVVDLPLDFASIEEGIDLIRFKIVLQYYSDIISGFSNREHLAPLIKRMETRVPDIKKLVSATDSASFDAPLVVVSLRDVNLSMRKVVPMLLCKHLYDRKKEEDLANAKYLNLIIDEAHNILSTESSRESEAWRDYRLETFEEIIKEGRKFGVFLTIASQRPHDISPTIISQLHNYFLHRLVNDLDIRAVEKAVAYLDRVSFESLPILPTGVSVLAGVSAQVPVMMKVSELAPEYAPNSRTMSVSQSWTAAATPGDSPVATGVLEPASSGDEPPF